MEGAMVWCWCDIQYVKLDLVSGQYLSATVQWPSSLRGESRSTTPTHAECDTNCLISMWRVLGENMGNKLQVKRGCVFPSVISLHLFSP